jgi:hypothetical protein
MASSKAEKLLKKMRKTKTGWYRNDLDALYEGYGFIIMPGGNHDKVTHPDFPILFTSLPRHRTVHKYLVTQAVKLIDRLLVLQGNKEETEESNNEEDETDVDE